MHTFNKAKLKALGEGGCLQPGPTYGPEHRIVVLSAGDPPDTPDTPDKGADKPSKELRDLAKQLSEDSERSTEVAERLNALADALDTEVEPEQDK